ncbi:MAG: septum formation initiator family protein [Oscillospiraceae bacterium]|nr:septum formation initiator family protein [Oscillospiraceae bacterium]
MKLKRSGILTKLLIIGLLVYLLVAYARTQIRIGEAEEQQRALQADVRSMSVSNAALEYEIEHCQDPETIEKVAREKLGLVLPGEIVFYDMSD